MALPETKPLLSTANPSDVFQPGKTAVTLLNVKQSTTSGPPKPLLLATPTVPGSYPVVMFFHGTALLNSFYSDLLHLIASHGYILVAPQLYTMPSNNQHDEINSASAVISWLPSGLPTVLPEKVRANLEKLSLSGHSRGGKTAFALALGYGSPSLPFAALIGIDPVAGTPCRKTVPHILTNVPQSFNISIPITVIGSGLGPEKRGLMSCPCAPEGFNYVEFLRESKPPCVCFVAADYGHMDVLNDNPPGMAGLMSSAVCKNGKGPRELMRRCCGGLVVASLKAYLENDKSYLTAIYLDPAIAPVKLDTVEQVISVVKA